MQLRDLEPRDVRPQLTQERRELLELLSELTADEWLLPTAAAEWNVKAVVLHLLDDDLGWLSRLRDGDTSGQLEVEEYRTFVDALDAKNQRWISGAWGLSPRVIIDLLKFSGEEMDRWWATLDLTAEGGVIWAGDSVPEWFDIAQDLTERWVHQMQIREAVGKVGDYAERYLPLVLETFVWALPHQFRRPAPVGSRINVDLGLVHSWHLERVHESGRWELNAGPVVEPAASFAVASDTAWRLLTGAKYDDGAVTISGDTRLAAGLLGMRGIIV